MNRKQIRKLTADLGRYNDCYINAEERAIIITYWNAIRANDDKDLQYYLSFGDSARQRIMNLRKYQEALKLGFTEYWFNKYGWIETPEFTNAENISFRQKSDNAIHNYLNLAKSPNDRWVYSYSLNFGGAGSSCGLGVFNKSYPTYVEAKHAALLYAKTNFEKAVTKNDSTNYKMPYCQQVLNEIEKEIMKIQGFIVGKKGQLQLF